MNLRKSFEVKVEFFTMKDLFNQFCQFDLKPNTTEEELRKLASTLNVDVRAATCIDDVFFLLVMEKIETQLNRENLIFIENYPPYQAALARLNNEGWGEYCLQLSSEKRNIIRVYGPQIHAD